MRSRRLETRPAAIALTGLFLALLLAGPAEAQYRRPGSAGRRPLRDRHPPPRDHRPPPDHGHAYPPPGDDRPPPMDDLGGGDFGEAEADRLLDELEQHMRGLPGLLEQIATTVRERGDLRPAESGCLHGVLISARGLARSVAERMKSGAPLPIDEVLPALTATQRWLHELALSLRAPGGFAPGALSLPELGEIEDWLVASDHDTGDPGVLRMRVWFLAFLEASGALAGYFGRSAFGPEAPALGRARAGVGSGGELHLEEEVAREVRWVLDRLLEGFDAAVDDDAPRYLGPRVDRYLEEGETPPDLSPGFPPGLLHLAYVLARVEEGAPEEGAPAAPGYAPDELGMDLREEDQALLRTSRVEAKAARGRPFPGGGSLNPEVDPDQVLVRPDDGRGDVPVALRPDPDPPRVSPTPEVPEPAPPLPPPPVAVTPDPPDVTDVPVVDPPAVPPVTPPARPARGRNPLLPVVALLLLLLLAGGAYALHRSRSTRAEMEELRRSSGVASSPSGLAEVARDSGLGGPARPASNPAATVVSDPAGGPAEAPRTRVSRPGSVAPGDETPATLAGSAPPATAGTTNPGDVPGWLRGVLASALGDRYDGSEMLGAGGMGTVVKAWDTRLERPVAIKVPPPHLSGRAEFRERFLREARALARLTHENIAGVYDVPDVPDGEVPVMIMEFLEGEDLGELLHRRGVPDLRAAFGWVLQAGKGIQHAHDQGILHRDIKPGNLMLVEGEKVKILDFGLAAVEGGPGLTRSGILMGSLPYMPPEQLRGEKVGAAADQFALAVTAFQLFTGRMPFADDDSQRRVAPHASSVRAGLPPAFDAVLARALAPDPATRYPSVREFLEAMVRIARGGAAGGAS